MSDKDTTPKTKEFDPSYTPDEIAEKIDFELERQEQKMDEIDEEFFINQYLGRSNAKKDKKASAAEVDKDKTEDDDLVLISSDGEEKPEPDEDVEVMKIRDSAEHEESYIKETNIEAEKVNTEEISEPTTTMPKIQIEIKKKPKNYVDNGLSEKEVEKKKEEILLNISKQVEQLETRELDIDYELYSNTVGNKHAQFLYNPVSISIYVPAGKLSLEQIIPSLTTFKYKSFNTPAVELLHSIPEKVIALKKLNSIFDYEFIDVSKTNRDFHLKDTDEVIANFFETRLNRISPLSIEYVIFTRFLQKLLFSLCSYEDLSFLTDTIQTNIQFKRILYTDFEAIKKTYAPKTRMRIAHEYIMKTINDTTVGAMIYKYKDYKDLNSKIEQSINKPNEFLLEQLFAGLLKTCLPSVSLSYLYAIRSCEVLCRFVGLYLQEERYKNKDTGEKKPFMEIVDDLYYIATISISLYEHEWSLMTQCVRSFPTVKGIMLKPETREYINSHLLSSGVYLLLKMLEKSIPIIAKELL